MVQPEAAVPLATLTGDPAALSGHRCQPRLPAMRGQHQLGTPTQLDGARFGDRPFGWMLAILSLTVEPNTVDCPAGSQGSLTSDRDRRCE